jgi:hypothetical protein
MLKRMEGWALWLFLVGLAAGVAVTAVLLWRLPRREDDVASDERRVEAAWIASAIERDGGIAPQALVEEVLELHQAYLAAPRTPGPPPGAVPPPVPPVAVAGPAGGGSSPFAGPMPRGGHFPPPGRPGPGGQTAPQRGQTPPQGGAARSPHQGGPPFPDGR